MNKHQQSKITITISINFRLACVRLR